MLYLITVLSTAILFASSVDGLKSRFRDCGAYNPSSQMKVPKLTLPPSIAIGKNNSIDVEVKVTGAVAPDDVVSMKISKDSPFGPVQAPCIFNVGSCTLPLKEWFKVSQDISCQLMSQFGLPCKADIKQGVYKNQIQIFVDQSVVPKLFQSFIPVRNLPHKLCSHSNVSSFRATT